MEMRKLDRGIRPMRIGRVLMGISLLKGRDGDSSHDDLKSCGGRLLLHLQNILFDHGMYISYNKIS